MKQNKSWVDEYMVKISSRKKTKKERKIKNNRI
jgi:hypothetical protein